MHGRGKPSLKPPILRRNRVTQNLDQIASLLLEQNADVALLQEADRKFFLTGNFNHVRYLTNSTGYRSYSGSHVALLSARYGTAVLSKFPIQRAASFPLKSDLPVLKKGYVEATINPGTPVDVLSVHFVWADFKPRKTRLAQARSLVEHINARSNKHPIIVGGDFNCGPQDEDTLRYLSGETGLQIADYSGKRKLRDWILYSSDFSLRNCAQLPARLSDHYPVLAELELLEAKTKSAEALTQKPKATFIK